MRNSKRHFNNTAGANLNPREVRGKHVGSDTYRSGDWWVECQRCGFDIYGTEAELDGYREGLIVCPTCKDVQHPQDFVRGHTDKITPDGPVTGTTDVANLQGGVDVAGDAFTHEAAGAEGSTEVADGHTIHFGGPGSDGGL